MPLRLGQEVQEVSRRGSLSLEKPEGRSEMLKPHNLGVFVLTMLILSLSLVVPDSERTAQAQGPVDPHAQNTARGIQLYQQGDMIGAAKVLHEVVKKHPDDADAWYYLGLAYNSEGSIGAARPAFEQLLRLRPDSADATAKLAYALILANQPERAIATAKHAIELGDQSPEPHYAIAEASFRLGASEKAVEEAENALRIKPDFVLALITKSLAHYSLKQYSDAAASLERFLTVRPDSGDANAWRGQLEELRQRAAQPPTEKPAAETPNFTGRDVTQKARVLSKPEPTYTEPARKAGVTGTVVLRVIFASDGEVKHIFVIRALGYGLTTQAIKAARLIKFDPAMKDGRPVSMYMQLEYNFNLY
jgi:TonB family protein